SGAPRPRNTDPPHTSAAVSGSDIGNRPNHQNPKFAAITAAVASPPARPKVSPAKSTTAQTASPAPKGATTGAAGGPPILTSVATHTGSSGKNAGIALPPESVFMSSPPDS